MYINYKTQHSVTFIQAPTCFDALVHHLQGALHLKTLKICVSVLSILSFSNTSTFFINFACVFRRFNFFKHKHNFLKLSLCF